MEIYRTGNMKKLIFFIVLVLIAVSERLWFDLGVNIELIMITSVLGSMYLGKKWGISIALMSLAVSDFVLGNTMIMFFTWSSFALIALFGSKLKQLPSKWNIVGGTGYGLISSLFFYLYTNFGVWLISGMYVKTWQGLIKCYVMGLPFLGIHALSNIMIFSGVFIFMKIINNLMINNVKTLEV